VVAGTNNSLRKLFICPGAPEAWKQAGLTYVYNDLIRGQLLDNVQDPASTWLMMDANMVSSTFPAPHLGGYNVLFCDGHVKWVQAQQLPTYWRPPTTAQGQGQGQGQGGGAGAGEDE
jgi:prepilin-type processing-associated H-X9-DG protein